MFFTTKDKVTLGQKKVEIPKLTRKRLKKLTDHIGTIGDFLVKLFLTPENNRASFIVAGADVAVDEIYELTSILSDIPIDELDDQASFSECVEFLRLTWEKNDMEKALGNVQALIHPMTEQFVISLVKGMEREYQPMSSSESAASS